MRELARSDVARVVDVFCDAFRDYPVMRFVLGPPGDDYPRRLSRLIGFFVAARALREEPLLGVEDGVDLVAAATMSYPDRESPRELAQLRLGVWQELGRDAEARYDLCGQAWGSLAVPALHVHVNMIGVRPTHRGEGHARSLLDHAHALSRATPGSAGITLTTEDPANLAFYERMGYVVLGHARVSPELETWGMFRPH